MKLTKRNEGKDPWGGYRLGLFGSLVVKRSDYGMTKGLLAVDDDVMLDFSFEGVRQ